MNKGKMRIWWAFVLAILCASSYVSHALPTFGITPKPTPPSGQLKGTAALCDPATATVDLDINNVRARMMNGGDMWYDRPTGTARYEVPKGSNKNALFAGSVWVGGYDAEGNLKVCAQTYRQAGNDYWPGPLDPADNSIDKSVCSEWDKIWRINRSDLDAFKDLWEIDHNNIVGNQYDDIKSWPALGNEDAVGKTNSRLDLLTKAVGVPNHTYAPFVDVDGDGVYNWSNGDYPDILGDQYTWWVFNDVGNTKTETGSGSIGMEVQTSAFAFSTKDYMNDATFINYRLINRGTITMSSTFMATWTDADLGYGQDDYVGCDTTRGLGILYNSKTPDGQGEVTSYGTQIPMVGVDFFIGPKHDTFINGNYKILDTLDMTVFNYFNNPIGGAGPTTDPHGSTEYLRVMTGYNRIGVHLHNDQAQGPNSTGYGPGPLTNFAYFGNPNNPAEWSQCQCGLPKTNDARFVHSSGPFTLYSGGITNDLTIGMVWVADVGACPNATFTKIRVADDLAQEYFDSKFKVIQGPDAPDMTIREADRSLIIYLTNDNKNSNNYKEQYGYNDSAKYHESAGKLAKQTSDSIYKFEGYRVFQLKNSSINAAQIFGADGQIDNTVAAEVFQTDIKNGITTIINYENDPIKNAYEGQLKVTGKDSGIVHSFRVTKDAFAQGADQRLVNYHNYYFVAVAYAYNNYRQFSYSLIDSTQHRPYLESKRGWMPGARGTIPVVAAMPNPTNGSMGTEDPAAYGDGVVIKRLEGTGNGHNFVQMDETSEATALQAPNYQEPYPVYMRNKGPVDVRVVDPRLVKPYDWELWLTGTNGDPLGTTGTGLVAAQSNWMLMAKDDAGATVATIYSDHGLNITNEQILTKYGISVNVTQVARPGDSAQVFGSNNGYIGSTVTFADNTKLWLSGVNDGESTSPTNWIRSGSSTDTLTTPYGVCDYKDMSHVVGTSIVFYDPDQRYENMLSQNSGLKSSWAPYALANDLDSSKSYCGGIGVAYNVGHVKSLDKLMTVDIVFTSDKSKWTRCPVVEMQDNGSLAEGHAQRGKLRQHAGWNLQVDDNGGPVYSTDPNDIGMSWFPGYAINQLTGKRVALMFGEDSYLKSDNGADMIWNPTSTQFGLSQREVINGGKHYIYVSDSLYDEGKSLRQGLTDASQIRFPNVYKQFQWVGLPLLTRNSSLLSINDGLIPTETRIQLAVDMPYRKFIPVAGMTLRNNGMPIYQFTTRDLAPRPLTNSNNGYATDKQGLLDRIRAVPNPYYGYTGYETNRLDTRVRFINLPNRATISIYSVDGTLIRRLEHANSEETTQGYEDWDVRNAKGLQIASGMYLVHINAEGIGETVIKWFGAMRPVDVTTY